MTNEDTGYCSCTDPEFIEVGEHSVCKGCNKITEVGAWRFSHGYHTLKLKEAQEAVVVYNDVLPNCRENLLGFLSCLKESDVDTLDKFVEVATKEFAEGSDSLRVISFLVNSQEETLFGKGQVLEKARATLEDPSSLVLHARRRIEQEARTIELCVAWLNKNDPKLKNTTTDVIKFLPGR